MLQGLASFLIALLTVTTPGLFCSAAPQADPEVNETQQTADVAHSETALSESRGDGIAEVLAQYAQVEAFESTCRLNCGRLALWFLAKRLGKLTSESGVAGMSLPADGKMSIAEIIGEGKKQYSLRLAARRFTSLKQIPPDSILVLGERHCLVLVGWQDDLPIVFEPSRVRLELLNAESLADWSGIALVHDNRLPIVLWGTLFVVVAALSGSFRVKLRGRSMFPWARRHRAAHTTSMS